jgi:hypothetical protein
MQNSLSLPSIRKYNIFSNNAYITNLNSNNLTVNGNTKLNNVLLNNIKLNNIDISGNLTVYNNTKLNNVDISGNLFVYGDVVLDHLILNNLDISGNLAVYNNTQLNNVDISGNLFVYGNTILDNMILNNLDISGNLTVYNNTQLNDVDISGNLVVNGDTSLDSVQISSNLVVNGLSTIQNLNVNANTTFTNFPTYQGSGIATISNQFVTLQSVESTRFINIQGPIDTASQTYVNINDVSGGIVGGLLLQNGNKVLLAGQGESQLASPYNGIYIYDISSNSLFLDSDTSGVNLYSYGYPVDNEGSDYYGSIFIEYMNPGITDSSGVAFVRLSLTYPKIGEGLIINTDGALQVNPILNFLSELNVSSLSSLNNVEINDTTQSTSSNTGALVVSGGVGIEKNLNVGGNTTISSNLTVSGNTQLNNADISGNLIFRNGTQQISAYTGGNAGTYTNCNLTIDSNGKISSISNGTSGDIASVYGIVNSGGEYGPFNINVSGGISGSWTQNSFFTIRITQSLIWGFTGSGNSNAQYYANTTGTYDIYPYRFVNDWCYVPNSTPLGNLSTNEINGNSSFGLVDTSSSNRIAPYGREFWGYNLVFNTNATESMVNNVQLYCSGESNQMQIYIINPQGWGSSGYPVQYSLTVELINVGNHYSTISTSGFTTNFSV